MDEETKVEDALNPEVEAETPTESAEEVVDIETYKKQIDAYQAQKVRAEKAEAELKKIKSQPATISSAEPLDLIKLGKQLQNYSDEELDFVAGAAKSKKPEDILKALENPFIQSGITAHREKVEKEKTLKPSGAQGMNDKPQTATEKILSSDSMAEKEEMLKKLGLYRDPRPRADHKSIGR